LVLRELKTVGIRTVLVGMTIQEVQFLVTPVQQATPFSMPL
jgi:hypothetical protein